MDSIGLLSKNGGCSRIDVGLKEEGLQMVKYD